MSSLNELNQRLAVATERNRQNNEQREALLAEAKEKFGCSTTEELKEKAKELEAESERLSKEVAEALAKAEEAVLAVEVATGVRQ